MALVLGAIIILLILYIIGVSEMTILTIILAGMFLMVLGTTITFIVANIMLIGAKRVDATYSRTEKNYWGSLDRVFYIVDDTEYPNIFPGEVAFKEILYKQDKMVKVLFTKGQKVFDRNAELCSRIGLVIGLIMTGIGIYIGLGLFVIT